MKTVKPNGRNKLKSRLKENPPCPSRLGRGPCKLNVFEICFIQIRNGCSDTFDWTTDPLRFFFSVGQNRISDRVDWPSSLVVATRPTPHHTDRIRPPIFITHVITRRCSARLGPIWRALPADAVRYAPTTGRPTRSVRRRYSEKFLSLYPR